MYNVGNKSDLFQSLKIRQKGYFNYFYFVIFSRIFVDM